jgi:MoaA/NifB/PqqE/SkfB family radical SAM enzyme
MRLKRLWRYRRILFSHRFAASLWYSRRNISASERGRSPVAGPYMAELDVTYRCNCRCRMCRRWQDPPADGLALADYQRLADACRDLGVYQVSIAGGEPLLRKDIFSIIASFTRYGMSVNLCTNGILVDQYLEPLRRSGLSCVTVSLDGATAPTHEKIRGSEAAFERVEKGIRLLAGYDQGERPLVRVRMTLSNLNVDELRAYHEKWEPIADDVLIQPVHHCETAFYAGEDPSAFTLDAKRLSRQIEGLSLEKDVYVKGLLESLRKDGGLPHHRCHAGLLMVRIDPWGNVYPCLEQHVCVGSLRDAGFKTLWHSDRFEQARREIAGDGLCACWYNNTALISRYGRWLQWTTVKGLQERHRTTN